MNMKHDLVKLFQSVLTLESESVLLSDAVVIVMNSIGRSNLECDFIEME